MQSLLCITAWYGDRRSPTSRHLSHLGSSVKPVWALPMCTGQQNFLTTLVRLNAKFRGHKAHRVTGYHYTAAVRQFLLLAQSYFQPDKVSRRLVGIRQGLPGFQAATVQARSNSSWRGPLYLIKSSTVIARLQPVPTSI
jgi:hypothetical protein